jgi:DHA1 family bicyclomycin/chloramphenicol resistance-like MFS transporter
MTAPLPRPPIALLVVMTMLSPIGITILTPSLPALVRAFDTDVARAQLTLSVYMVGIAAGQLIVGALSDRFGRRPVMLVGLSILTLGGVLAAFAPTIEALIAARLLQALGGCAGMALTRAMVRDVHAPDRAASMLGYVGMAMVIGPMFSPLIGGLLERGVGWWASMLFLALVAGSVLLAAYFVLPETNRAPSTRLDLTSLFANFAMIARSRDFLGYALSSALMSSCYFCFVGSAPYLVIDRMGLSPDVFGLWFLVIASGYSLGGFVAGRLSVRFGGRRMNLIGLSVGCLGAALFAVVNSLAPLSLPGLHLPVWIMGIGQGINMPNAASGAVSGFPRLAGAASGLMGCIHMTLGGLTILAIGVFAQGGVGPVIVGVVLAQGLAVLSYRLVRVPVAKS